MSGKGNLPWWLKYANRIIIPLNRLGLTLGTMHILTQRGRKSGKLRSTPVSLVTVGGKRYIVTGFETQWVKNARASNRALLERGRKKEQVMLVEIPSEERAPILREFPRQVPHGVQFFEKMLNLPNDPEAFASAAPRCPVFRIDSLPVLMD
jgi:deazaflavin-dependent oxidoreductase (nitroreductase family)